ncbi:hypothetical protein CEP54_007474 [Fusarium duplospermum]|uniref:LysM domain-containing protein n=1 Tax=Fusarium duplospermum TaxID=1325734 RepID=A0A428Q1B1_9HYPO|nr:hypothetical protein CEP54_007474 [Fusarium duplospermum]
MSYNDDRQGYQQGGNYQGGNYQGGYQQGGYGGDDRQQGGYQQGGYGGDDRQHGGHQQGRYQQGGYQQGGYGDDRQQGGYQQGGQGGYQQGGRPGGLADTYFSENQQHQGPPGYGNQGPPPYNQSQGQFGGPDGPDGERGVMGALAGGAAGGFGGYKLGGKTGHTKTSAVVGALAGAFAGHKLQDTAEDWKDDRDEKKEEEKRREEEERRRREEEKRRRDDDRYRRDDEGRHRRRRGSHSSSSSGSDSDSDSGKGRRRRGNYAGNFTASSRDIHLDTHGDYILSASCGRGDGSRNHSSISLNRVLENHRGSFRWVDGGKRGGSNTVTVQQGDTLRTIAARFNCSFDEIARHNNINNPDLIYPGQTLQVPGGGSSGGYGNFGDSARNVRLVDGGQKLEAELSHNGEWCFSSVVLDERIENNRGELRLI